MSWFAFGGARLCAKRQSQHIGIVATGLRHSRAPTNQDTTRRIGVHPDTDSGGGEWRSGDNVFPDRKPNFGLVGKVAVRTLPGDRELEASEHFSPTGKFSSAPAKRSDDGAFARTGSSGHFSALRAGESGAEATAIQTLRDFVGRSSNVAERLDCGAFTAAFSATQRVTGSAKFGTTPAERNSKLLSRVRVSACQSVGSLPRYPTLSNAPR